MTSHEPYAALPALRRATGNQGPTVSSVRWRYTVATLLSASLAFGCGEADATKAPPPTSTKAAPGVTSLPPDVSAEKAVRDLITAVTPLPPDATPAENNDWFARRKQTLQRMRAAGDRVGLEALQAYTARARGLPAVRIGLLDVAAHGAPTETAPLLRELITEFGEDLMIRTAACRILAQTSPADAAATLEPILNQRRRTRTYPPEDRILSAWLVAKRSLGEDPSDVLAAVATNLNEYPEARHLAVRELANTESPRGQQALRQLLVESGHNMYLRRLAAQSLRETLPKEEFCMVLTEISGNEADLDFQIFLNNMMERFCR